MLTRYIRAIPPGFLVKKEHRKVAGGAKGDRSIPYEEGTSRCRGEGQQFGVDFPEEGSGDWATYRITAAGRPQALAQARVQLWRGVQNYRHVVCVSVLPLNGGARQGNRRCSFTGGAIRLEMAWANERWSLVSPRLLFQ